MTWMDHLLLGWAILTLAVVLSIGLAVLLGLRRVGHLEQTEPSDGDDLPLVSVVVPARNEERNLERALRSLLELDYPRLEIIALDDRSTDKTGAILDRLAAEDERLQVVHIAELPDGWLGKNHALYLGARQARGQLLLFTDADVIMDRSALRRAVRLMTEQQLDHLAVLPQTVMPGWLLQAFVVTFALYFASYWRPWNARRPSSRCHIGVGAFNLMRREVYEAIGTYQAIAMRPDDDMKLGKLVKQHGYRQDLVYAGPLIRVPWYGSLRELISGLEKNLFAGVEYRISTILVSSLIIATMHVWPFVAVLVAGPTARPVYLAVVLWLLLLCWAAATGLGVNRWAILGFPLAAALFIYLQTRAMLLALKNRGIRWRGTHYPLAQLKANKV